MAETAPTAVKSDRIPINFPLDEKLIDAATIRPPCASPERHISGEGRHPEELPIPKQFITPFAAFGDPTTIH